MKLLVKRSALAGMGGFAAVIIAALLLSQETRSIGIFFLVFAAAFLLLNVLLFLPASKLRRRGAKGVSVALICAANLVLALGVSVYYLQEKMFFYPSNSVDCFEQMQTEPAFRKVAVTAKDGTKLSGWLRINSKAEKAPLVLYFGGNGQNSFFIVFSRENIGECGFFSHSFSFSKEKECQSPNMFFSFSKNERRFW